MQELPVSMMTLNLHLAQHLATQARVRGPPAVQNEMFVERAIQPHKSFTKHRVSRRPEAVIARQLADDTAMAILARKPGMLTFDQHVQSFRSKELLEPRYDAGSDDSLLQMLHCARAIKLQARPLVRQMLQTYLMQHAAAVGQPACLTPAELEDAKGWQIFTAARTASGVIHSRLHTRATRTSCFVTLQQAVQGSNRVRTVMVEVMYFLRILRTARGLPPLRLAACRTFKEQPKKDGMFVARTHAAGVQHERVALDLHSLGAALVTVKLGDGKLLGVPYFNQSRAI